MRQLYVLPLALTLCLTATASAQVRGTFTSFGMGCARASTTPPTLTAITMPEINKVFAVTVGNVPSNSTVLVLVGDSDKQWGALNLPFNLAALGGPNCTLYVSGQCLEICPTSGNNTLPLRVFVPNDSNLIGAEFFMQVWSRDVQSNPGGFALSHPAKGVIGG